MPNKKSKSISQQVAGSYQGLFILSFFVQIVTVGLFLGYLAYKDAVRRAEFLSHSNETALGLMLSTGDFFQLKSAVSSFRSIETPEAWLLDEQGRNVIVDLTPSETYDYNPARLQWKGGNLLLRSAHSIRYNNHVYGQLILLNRVRVTDWLLLSGILLTVTLVFFLLQGKYLERISLRLASAISGLGSFFVHAHTEYSLRTYLDQRQKTSFIEVEVISDRIYELLRKILQNVETEKEKEKFKAVALISAHVAHDLRHPLSVFNAMARVSNWSSYQHMQPQLERALARIENMIEGLRHGEMQMLVRLQPGTLDLGSVIAEALPVAREKNVILRREGSVSEIHGAMDQDKLVRSCLNIIFNAMEAGASELVIRAQLLDSVYKIEFEDNGPGVPQLFISRLFTEGGTFGKHGGTGLGLAFVKKTILSHHGTIDYERRERTTVFRITLPAGLVAKTPPASLPASPVLQQRRSMPRVFLGILDKEFEQNIRAGLPEEHLIRQVDEISLGDLIYSDRADIIQISLEKKNSLMPHISSRTAEGASEAILRRLNLMRKAVEARQHET